jgi:hypothetical protein
MTTLALFSQSKRKAQLMCCNKPRVWKLCSIWSADMRSGKAAILLVFTSGRVYRGGLRFVSCPLGRQQQSASHSATGEGARQARRCRHQSGNPGGSSRRNSPRRGSGVSHDGQSIVKVKSVESILRRLPKATTILVACLLVVTGSGGGGRPQRAGCWLV